MTLVLEEYRRTNKAVVLEKTTSDFNGKRYLLSTLTKRRFDTEEEARNAFEQAKKRRYI